MGLWEVLTSGHARAEEARALLVVKPAASCLQGVVATEPEGGGWMRPHRLLGHQQKALSSCLAWHPGLFRQMSTTTAGVCLRFVTDAHEVALAIRMDPEPRGTRSALAELDRDAPRRAHDGVAAVVDGRHLGCLWPRALARPLPWIEESQGMGLVTFSLGEKAEAEVMTIPGLGERHEVELWLPCLRGCLVRELWCDGTYAEPLPSRPRMLVLGDAISQGFCCDDPSCSWPALAARDLGRDLLNQSVRGQVFQGSSLPDPRELTRACGDVGCVVVFLGARYRREACSAAAMARDAYAYLRDVARAWRDVPCWAVTPIWHDEERSPSRAGSCWEDVPATVAAAAHDVGMAVVDGARLLDGRPELLADGEHPTGRGHKALAKRLAKAIRADGGPL